MNIKNLWKNIKMKSKLLQKKLGIQEKTELESLKVEVKEEKAEVAAPKEEVKEDNSLNITAYDVIKDPEKPGNHYLAVEINYNLRTKKTSFIVRPFNDRTAAMSMIMDKENRKYLFEKNRGVKR